MKAKNVTVYSTPSCPYCHMAKDFLQEHHIRFTDINVAENEQAAMQMIRKSGQNGVPVIEIDGKIIVGFDKSAIKRALGV